MSTPVSALTWALIVVLSSLGCATNPISGKSEIILVSPEEEEKAGREGDEMVAAEMGFVEDGALAAYVSSVGERVARHAPAGNVTWSFKVLDVEVPNAFAPFLITPTTPGMLYRVEY